MPTNVAGQFTADIENFIADEVLPLARRRLVAFQFGDPLTLPKGRGTVYTATRYQRIPLPYAPLAEGVPPLGQTITLQQVTAFCQQWGDRITLSDVAELTIKHPLMHQAKRLIALQIGETLDRNTFVSLMAGTQVNTVNARGSRGALVTGDVMNVHENNRAFGALDTIGSPRFDGDEETDIKLKADAGGAKASNNPRTMPHYTSIAHPLVVQDLRENSTFVLASSYSDVYRLYNSEVGEWGGIRFCSSQLVPFWTGYTALTTASAGTTGNLATGTYYIVITASDTQNQYESQIWGVTTGIAVTGPNGSINVPLPVLAGYTFNVYVGTTTSPGNLGLSPQGPLSGTQQGQAVQLAPNGGVTVTITGVGAAQIPPAAPANGLTVYPTFIFGRGAYGQVVLDNVKITLLTEADKSDPLNQLRVVGWKSFWGTILLNQLFFMRIESLSNFSASFA
jgi:N4-gp56 family major capsid protein